MAALAFRTNVENLQFSTIMTNAIVTACSLAIAIRWSDALDAIIDIVVPSDGVAETSVEVIRLVGTAIVSTCFLVLTSGIVLRIGDCLRQVRESVTRDTNDIKNDVRRDTTQPIQPVAGSALHTLPARSQRYVSRIPQTRPSHGRQSLA